MEAARKCKDSGGKKKAWMMLVTESPWGMGKGRTMPIRVRMKRKW